MTFWDQFEKVESSPQSQQQENASQSNQQPEIQTQQSTKENQTQDFWSQFQKAEKPETSVESFKRQTEGATSKAFANVLGLPGDIEGLLRTVISSGQKGEGGLIGKISKEPLLPTSSYYKDIIKKERPDLEPRNKKEELQQEFLGDYVLAPGGVLRKAVLSGAGIVGKEIAKSYGAGEKGQNYTKLGILFLGGLRQGGQNARQLSTDLYQARDAALQGRNLSHNSTRFTQNLNDLRTRLNRGTPGPGENAVISRIDDLLQKSQSGFIDIRDLTAAQRQINEARGALFDLPANARRNARQAFHDVSRDIQTEIQSFGRTHNPEFLRLHNAANEVYGAVQASQVVGNMIQRIAPIMDLKSPIASALSHGVAGTVGASVAGIAKVGLKSAFPITAAAAAGSALYNTGQILYRIYRSPHLRDMYGNLVRDSLQGNAAAAVSHLQRLDEALEKDLEKHP